MLGVCYYPEHWPERFWAEDARRMRDLGIAYVRIGEFAWSRLEPSRGDWRWDWMDRAFAVLSGAGLGIVLGTPTATPPKWLIDEFPEVVPVGEDGRQRGFGSRRHYTFSSEVYRRESARIVEALAKRYGDHPGLVGWQTDNEYGCHDTVLSWGTVDLAAFRSWLRRRYQTPEMLNDAWGAVFWSMEVGSFEEISLPNLTVTEANPAARLDFRRFASEEVRAYNRMQVEIIRRHSPGRWITHNFMGFFNEFDHFDVGEDIDLASWDSYPIGFVERFPFSDEERARWHDTSHPDIAPFHHDLYRAVGRGRFWVMEQQPGPVNWAPYNPVPAPGMVRLWTLEAHAHGGEVVSYFRWRQAPWGQEQMHAGLNLPSLQELSPGGHEARQAALDLAALGPLPPARRAAVALVYDYTAAWVCQIQPQGASFNYVELAFRWYEALRRLGLDIDIVRPGAPLDGYRLVVVPSLPIVTDAAASALAAATGQVLYGPRTASKTRNFSIPDGLPPAALRDLLPLRVTEVSSLRPGLGATVSGTISGSAERWIEHIESDAEPLSVFADGRPAIVSRGRHTYVGFWPDLATSASLMRHAAARADLAILELPEAVRLRRLDDLCFAFNYGPEAWQAPFAGRPVLGANPVPPRSVTAWRAGPSGDAMS
jgi:beta-galactosidase